MRGGWGGITATFYKCSTGWSNRILQSTWGAWPSPHWLPWSTSSTLGRSCSKRSWTARCNYKTNQAEVRKDMLDDFLSLAGELQVILTSNQSGSRGVQLFSINGVSDHPSMCCGPNCVQPSLCFNLMIPFSSMLPSCPPSITERCSAGEGYD